jgi:hypothetical protein
VYVGGGGGGGGGGRREKNPFADLAPNGVFSVGAMIWPAGCRRRRRRRRKRRT